MIVIPLQVESKLWNKVELHIQQPGMWGDLYLQKGGFDARIQVFGEEYAEGECESYVFPCTVVFKHLDEVQIFCSELPEQGKTYTIPDGTMDYVTIEMNPKNHKFRFVAHRLKSEEVYCTEWKRTYEELNGQLRGIFSPTTPDLWKNWHAARAEYDRCAAQHLAIVESSVKCHAPLYDETVKQLQIHLFRLLDSPHSKHFQTLIHRVRRRSPSRKLAALKQIVPDSKSLMFSTVVYSWEPDNLSFAFNMIYRNWCLERQKKVKVVTALGDGDKVAWIIESNKQAK